MKAKEVKNGGKKTVRKLRRKKDRAKQKWRMMIDRLKTLKKKKNIARMD